MPSQLNVDSIRPNTSGGAVLFPDRPSFFLQGTSNADKSVANNEYFGATDDGQAAFSTTANGAHIKGFTYNSATGEITVPQDGVYLVGGCFYQNQNATGRVSLYVNADQRGFTHNGSNLVTTSHVQQVIELSADDKIRWRNTIGGARNYYEGANHTYVYGYLIG